MTIQLDAANAQSKGDMFGGLASRLGSMAGGYFAGPAGAAVGGLAGK